MEVGVEDAVARVVVVGGRVAVAGLVAQVGKLTGAQEHQGANAMAGPA